MTKKEAEIREFHETSGMDLFVSGDGGRSAEESAVATLRTKRSECEFKQARVSDKIADLKLAMAAGPQRAREEWLNQLDDDVTIHTSIGTDGRMQTQSRRERIFQLRLEKSKLLGRFGAKHPDVLEIDQQIKAHEDFYSGKDQPLPDLQDAEAQVSSISCPSETASASRTRDEDYQYPACHWSEGWRNC